MVSRYTNPVVSSFTTRLELTLKRLGLDTIPMDIVPTGISWSTSTSSRVLKQVTTPVKPRGGVGGLTNASVLAGRGDFGGDGALGGVGWWVDSCGLGELMGSSLHLQCSGWLGGSPVATTGWGGCTTVSHPAYFGATFGMDGISGVAVAPGASVVAAAGAEGLLPSSSGRSTP